MREHLRRRLLMHKLLCWVHLKRLSMWVRSHHPMRIHLRVGVEMLLVLAHNILLHGLMVGQSCLSNLIPSHWQHFALSPYCLSWYCGTVRHSMTVRQQHCAVR